MEPLQRQAVPLNLSVMWRDLLEAAHQLHIIAHTPRGWAGFLPTFLSLPPLRPNIPSLENMRHLPGRAQGRNTKDLFCSTNEIILLSSRHQHTVQSVHWPTSGCFWGVRSAYLLRIQESPQWEWDAWRSACPPPSSLRQPAGLGLGMAQLPPVLWQAEPSHLQTCLCSSPC